MVKGEQLQDHVLIRLPFTLYCLPKRYALGVMRFCCERSELTTDSFAACQTAANKIRSC
jgi:hypothetical protein